MPDKLVDADALMQALSTGLTFQPHLYTRGDKVQERIKEALEATSDASLPLQQKIQELMDSSTKLHSALKDLFDAVEGHCDAGFWKSELDQASEVLDLS